MKLKNKDNGEIQSPLKFTKKIVIFCIFFITVYTLVAIVFQAMTGNTLSDVLTERVFTCLIGELAITGLLKIVESFLKFKFSDVVDSIEDVDTDGEGLGDSDDTEYSIDDILNELKGE